MEKDLDTGKYANRLRRINMTNILITSSANTGLGFWTSICEMFASIFGVESKNVLKKQNKVLNKAVNRLVEKISEYNNVKSVTDFRVTWQSGLAVTLSIIIVVDNKKEVTPKENGIPKETQNSENKKEEDDTLERFSNKEKERLKKELLEEIMNNK